MREARKRKIASGVAVRGDSGVAGEGRVVGVKASLFGNDYVMHSCLTHLIFCTVHVIRSELIKI